MDNQSEKVKENIAKKVTSTLEYRDSFHIDPEARARQSKKGDTYSNSGNLFVYSVDSTLVSNINI